MTATGRGVVDTQGIVSETVDSLKSKEFTGKRRVHREDGKSAKEKIREFLCALTVFAVVVFFVIGQIS
jgi:hypothetical protein